MTLSMFVGFFAFSVPVGRLLPREEHARAPITSSIQVCEEIVKLTLTSPGSYRRAVALVIDTPDAKGRNQRTVDLEFDAGNPYGAVHFGSATCREGIETGLYGMPHMRTASVNGKSLNEKEMLVLGILAESHAAKHYGYPG